MAKHFISIKVLMSADTCGEIKTSEMQE